MCAKKSGAVLVVGVAWLLAMGAFCIRGAAEQPELVWREFLLLGRPGETFEDLPDFQAEGSQILATHPPTGDPWSNQSTPVWFLVGDDPSRPYVEEFFGTTWYCFGEATHATADGPKTYRFFWKDELPPTGAVAQTGPQGDVMQGYYWERAPILEGGNGWVVESERDPWLYDLYRPMVHGAGWFSR
jgi:hypothetical protein